MNGPEALRQIADLLRKTALAYGATMHIAKSADQFSPGMYALDLQLFITEPVGPPLGAPPDLGVNISEAIAAEDKVR